VVSIAPITIQKGAIRMSMLIDPELHRAFKVAAAAQGTTMTDVLVAYIRSYVEKYSPSARPMKKGGRA